MASFRIDSIAALARQMNFTPHDTRSVQLTSAEELLHAIEPNKAYPLEFVIFRVTGYRPKQRAKDLLTGVALQHDLGLLIEHVSETLDVRTDSLPDPVLTIEDVTERFNVTSKTIQRWRRKGLPARRFVFADGKRRVGFLLGSVERFFSGHREQVERGTNFSQVGDDERAEIFRRARRLATHCGCCVNEIARRVGRRMNRSPLTILHTIRKHDAENASAAIFPYAAPEIGEDQRSQVVRGFKRGLSIQQLAKRACRPASAIYRIVIDERIARLNRRKVKFIDDALYHQPDAEHIIDEIVSAEEIGVERSREDDRIPRDLPPYLAELYRTPLLTPSRERALFLKFNFHKYQFVAARRRLEPQFARARDLGGLEASLRRATETKNAIVRANLRLVVNIARKHMRPGVSLMELISDGNLTLMRAVESFDTHKGNRFSTYATLALMKGFARSVPMMLAGRARGMAGEEDSTLAEIPDHRPATATDHFIAREEVRQLLASLGTRERDVLLAHYGLGEDKSSAPATYEQLGQRLGLSKQRVRQIEQSALAKLRAVLALSK